MFDFMPNMAGMVAVYFLQFLVYFRDRIFTKTKDVNRTLS